MSDCESGGLAALSRRRFLQAMGASAVGVAAPAVIGVSSCAAAQARSVDFVHARTAERFSGVYFENGAYIASAMAWADWVLRDVNVDRSAIMSNALIDLLARVKARIGGREIIVTSGYRSRDTNERLRRVNRRVARNSLHVEGRAVDFYSPGVSPLILARIARTEGVGGVGVYRGARFIHVDDGPVRVWRG